ncbi:MAG TPA: universal stress protein [Thermodesulfobacteriota bacterium]|nr:universal stress protein [Thermodesulfobacteriota bacterium]
MVHFNNILYCTDFSEVAKAALPYAIDLTKKYGATLHIVHVYLDPGHIAEFEISSEIKMDWIRVAHSMGNEAEKKLKEFCSEVGQDLTSCHSKMLRGKPYFEILRYAKENSIELIVMASHGLSGWEHALFGSTAERVLRESPCPVLVIRKPK